MAEASQPPTVKLICGMISARRDLFDLAGERLEQAFGPTDLASEVMPFDFTQYYDGQMGSPLLRKFVAFSAPFSPEALVDAKRLTNDLECRLAEEFPAGPPRPINLDPGYVEASKLVLASMKNFSHRIYMDRGVYAEVTLMYRKGGWQALEWTFPDYASPRYHPFLTAVRNILREATPSDSHQELL